MLFTPSDAGFLLLDEALKLLATNKEAERILIYPTSRDKIRQLPILLSDKVRSHLVSRKPSGAMEFSREYTSGRRRYVCRVYSLSCHEGLEGAPAYALLLERHSSGMTVLGAVAQQFSLTEREMETVRLLVQGLTSKEIAARMNISPNTVKAFLRLVMVKMGVSTRSGIAGRIFGSGG